MNTNPPINVRLTIVYDLTLQELLYPALNSHTARPSYGVRQNYVTEHGFDLSCIQEPSEKLR